MENPLIIQFGLKHMRNFIFHLFQFAITALRLLLQFYGQQFTASEQPTNHIYLIYDTCTNIQLNGFSQDKFTTLR